MASGIAGPALNFLILFTDQQRWDTLGVISPWMHTPNLDRLALDGVVFTQCITSSPQCIPARLSLMTGLYPHNTGVWQNIRCALNPAFPTWIHTFQQHGYRCSLIGKSHLHPHEGDLRDRQYLMTAYGFEDVIEVAGPLASMTVRSAMTDDWEASGLWELYRADFEERRRTKPQVARPSALGLAHYYDVFVAAKAVDYLQHYRDSRPWLCWVGFPGPHEPWDTPEPYASMYTAERMPVAIPRPQLPRERHKGQLDLLLEHTSPSRPILTADDIAAIRVSYAGEISLIDRLIGDILATVHRRGEWERTVIVFVSDHGEMNGDYGLLRKGNFLESAIRIPLIVKTPQSARARQATVRRNPALIELLDLGPTLLDMIDASPPRGQWGVSFLPALSGANHTHRTHTVAEYAGEIMIRTHRWKLALNAAAQPYLLFDLHSDPREQRNLAHSWRTRRIRHELSATLLTFLISTLLPGSLIHATLESW